MVLWKSYFHCYGVHYLSLSSGSVAGIAVGVVHVTMVTVTLYYISGSNTVSLSSGSVAGIAVGVVLP